MTWLAAFLAAGVFLTGCSQEKSSSSESATEETTAATVATATTEETEPATEAPTEPELKTIGEKAEGEHVYNVTLKNATGKEISGVAIKDSSQSEFPENMMKDSDVFAADEERVLYYDATEAIAANAAEETDSDKILTPEYTIQLTFSDGTTAELHQFPFDDVEAAEIHWEDEIAYLVYTSVSSQTEVNTKEAEQMQVQTSVETEPAAQDAEEVAAEDGYQEQQPVYVEPEESPDETPAAAPVENTPAEEIPANNNDTADPNNGCLGDEGLFN